MRGGSSSTRGDTFMGYEVLVRNLRFAAGDYRTVATSLGTDGVDVTNCEPDSLGHIELAAWLKAVAEQCDKATKALHDGATDLAGSLGAAARHYDTTDQLIGQTFRDPLSGPLYGPPSYGPPSYGTAVVRTAVGKHAVTLPTAPSSAPPPTPRR